MIQKTPYFLLSLLFATLTLIYSCDDVVIENLKDKKVTLLAPEDGFTSNIENQTFWWETLKGAEEYQIRIVSPSFDNITTIVANETVTTTSYTTSLAPGTYQWRVNALNSGSQTETADIYTLIISADSTLESQVINIVAPIDNYETKDTSIQLLWNPLSNAAYYRIQVTATTFDHPSFIILDDTTSSDVYTINLPEGGYSWRIRAENDNSNSIYTTQSIFIDTTPPTAPILTNYFNSDTVQTANFPITLAWTAATDAIQDTIYIYTDSLLNNELNKVAILDTYNFSDTSSTQYYWQVRSVDVVGNIGMYSSVGHFILED